MPSRGKSRGRRSKRSYRYSKRSNLLHQISSTKRSRRRSSRRRASSVPKTRIVRVSPRKLVDISVFTSTRRFNRSIGRDGFQKVNRSKRRSNQHRYRVTAGGSPRKSKVHSITSRMGSMHI